MSSTRARPRRRSARTGRSPFDWAVGEQVRPESDDPDPGWADLARRVRRPVLLVGGGASSHVPQEHVAELVGGPAGRTG